MSYSARDKSGFEKYDILGYKVYLNRKHGKQLLALTDYYELVWATTWEHLANEHIAPKIGLPELPVIEFGTRYAATHVFKNPMIKSYKVVEYAAGRPFAWIDDDIWAVDREYLVDMDCECLPLAINSSTGLVGSDFSMLRIWGKEQCEKVQANSA
jgi:hypothetical protein